MRRPVVLALAAAVAFAVGAGGLGVARRTHRHAARRTPIAAASPAPALASAASSEYLRAADLAYQRSTAWWDNRRGWYRQFLPGTGNTGLATMWGIVHLFGTVNALAIANPTPSAVAAARSFADVAERYWNPDLRPVPGYSPQVDVHRATERTWYDDEAWWGVAFFDAYRATGDRRYLADAARSLRFTDSGWDPRRGGIYWDIHRTFKSSESLAGATLTAAGLYQVTHQPRYLALATRYIDWANRTIRAKDGLYGGRSTPAGPMAYVEGPMAEALIRLCQATGKQSYCRSGERLMRATAAHFKVLQQGPQYDAIYIRSVVEIYRHDHNPRWYRIATSTADRAMTNAARPDGLYLLTWDGRPISSIGAPEGKLQTHAATTSVLAWTAAAKAPPGRIF